MRAAVLTLCLPVLALAGEPDKKEAKAPEPMAAFERLVGNEWRVTAQSGKSMYHTWHPGPGKHSIRRMTDGHGASGEPWREIQVYYWHPDRKEVRLLGLSPVARGVSEGSIRFEKGAAEGEFDLHQTGGLRKMGLEWAFDGADKFHDTLLESSEGGKPTVLVDFDHVRVKPPAKPRTFAVEGRKPSERLKAFAPLLGHSWEAKGEWSDKTAVQTRTDFLWVPVADVIYVRVTGKNDEHLLDAYVYHHTGAKALRCLALTSGGGVFEGDVSVLKDDAIHLDLKGLTGSRYAVQFDFEKDGLRQRIWSVKGAEKTLQLEVRHKKAESR